MYAIILDETKEYLINKGIISKDISKYANNKRNNEIDDKKNNDSANEGVSEN